MRHAGVLTALLLTAALLAAIPGLFTLPAQNGRTDDSLRPPQLRTLTVWLMPGDLGDRKLLSELCAAFEKEHRGVRIFLRVVTADEFSGETAVLPDVALFTTGDITIPEKIFLPLENGAASGQFAGVQRAMPLWLSPNVLSIPQEWLNRSQTSAPKMNSLLASATAVPAEDASSVLAADELPWGMLKLKNAVAAPEGVGWQQLLACCPEEWRAQLVSGVLGLSAGSSAPSPETEEWVTTVPYSRTASPTPMPSITVPAKAETLGQHQARLKKGEALSAFVFPLAVSDRVRYAALCRDGTDARALMQFLLMHQENALQHGLIPPGSNASVPDPLVQALIDAYRSCALPNAFTHTRQELLQLCQDGFARCEDPVRTLLRLR